jgi:2-dehydro-3-deoxyphosphooctonate aldolase (KDO 8-P synthase)
LKTRKARWPLRANLKALAAKLEIPFIFKASYDKANRTSIRSYRGRGSRRGCRSQKRQGKSRRAGAVRRAPLRGNRRGERGSGRFAGAGLFVPPDGFCRRNREKGAGREREEGQFLAPWDVANIIEKIKAAGNRNILITERGASFGYNNLVFDVRSLPIMRQMGFPVIFDATHSVQLPGGMGTASGGQRDMVPYLARAAVAAGVDGVFMEVHPDPEQAHLRRSEFSLPAFARGAADDAQRNRQAGEKRPLDRRWEDIHAGEENFGKNLPRSRC